MKGQTQALTAVLITSVTVGAISAAYVWGVPLLEKRESQSQLETVEQDALQLHNSIISTSNSGSGTSNRLELNIPDGSITINESEDYIDIQSESQDPPYPAGTWTLIEGDNLQNTTIAEAGAYGIKEQDLPGIVAVNAQQSTVQYRIDFRNIRTASPSKIEKIDLEASSGTQASGEINLLISNNGIETSNMEIDSENLNVERTAIEIDIQ